MYTTKPVRESHRRVWLGRVEGIYCRLLMDMESRGYRLPSLTWDDEPVEVELTLSWEA